MAVSDSDKKKNGNRIRLKK